jgi:hypothetical protein
VVFFHTVIVALICAERKRQSSGGADLGALVLDPSDCHSIFLMVRRLRGTGWRKHAERK